MQHIISCGLIAIIWVGGALAFAQSDDMSPVLLVESLPSVNPVYRRVVRVSYLEGDNVKVTYETHNRVEFKQVENTNADIKSLSLIHI